MRSVMNHSFANAPTVDIPRSTFNRSHGIKTTFDAGKLIPIFWDLCYPGDTATVKMDGFARLSTPIYPLLDNVHMETFFFEIPVRLVWDNFQKFMGEQINPGDSIDYTIPQIPINNAAEGSLADYFGMPTKIAATYNVNSIWFRAYQLLINEWFRDQNLMDSWTVDKDDGPDTYSDYDVRSRCKRHDYFTSCLPNLQKGDAVMLPLGDSAPVFGKNMPFDNTTTGLNLVEVMDGQGPTASQKRIRVNSPDLYGYSGGGTGGLLSADLTMADGATINEWREAVQVQKLLERDMRSGTRYTEIVQSHFRVQSADSRLQRPSYLGGGYTPIIINPIAQTSGGPGAGTGDLGAMGVARFKNHGFTKSFTEHCLVIGLVNVRADLTYQEGLDRLFSDQTRYDWYYPVLAHLGEQAVLNKELFMDAASIGSGATEEVFGYQERWAHMRYKKSLITGAMRSNAATPLDAWHLCPEFGSMPTLDETFITDNPPIDRVIATPTEPHFKFDGYCNYYHTRPMPVYSVPGLTDHF